MGFEAVLKEASPEIYNRLLEIQESPLDVFIDENGVCDRCGAYIQKEAKHNQWHRDLTFAMNFGLTLAEVTMEKVGADLGLTKDDE